METSVAGESRLWPRLAHQPRDDETRDERERRDEVDGCRDTDEVRDSAREQCPDGVSEIAPESVDAEAGRAPRGVRMVRDRSEERRVDYRRAEPLQRGADQPRDIGRYQDRQPDPTGLHDHAPRD